MQMMPKEDQGHRCQIVCLEEIQNTRRPRAYIHETDDLRRDRCTDICTEYNADRLIKSKKTRTDKTHRQNDRSRRALDHAGDEHTEYKSDDRSVGDLGKGHFHGASRRLFQSVTHEAHSIEEHCKTSEEGYDLIKYVHFFYSPLEEKPDLLRKCALMKQTYLSV